MSTPVTYVGNIYNVPAYQDTGYAQGSGNLSSYLIALATGSLTLSGGTFTLTADANFGANFGLKSIYYKSRAASISSTGILRMARTEFIGWLDQAGSNDLELGVNASDQLTYNGLVIATSTGALVGTNMTLTDTSNQMVIGTTRTVTLTLPTPASTSRVVTIPDLAGDYSVVGTIAAQTIAGVKTFSSGVVINPTTNQLVLGVTNTTTISATAPASSAVYTIPDVGTTANFILSAGTQTIGGAKTFTADTTVSSATTTAFTVSGSLSANKLTSLLFNTESTNGASNARMWIKSGGASGGDPLVNWGIQGILDWVMGIDNSDSDKLKISASDTLGSSDILTFTTAGLATFTGVILHAAGTDAAPNAFSGDTNCGFYSAAADSFGISVGGSGNNHLEIRQNGQVSLSVLNSARGAFGALVVDATVLTLSASTSVSVPATIPLYLDGGGDSFISETAANIISTTVNGTARFRVSATASYIICAFDTVPDSAAGRNLGDAVNYWNDVSYKTLSDRGCLPWCDDGVELNDGRVVSDLDALCQIQKHPTKKTPAGLPRLDYQSFPKHSFKKVENENPDWKVRRDSNGDAWVTKPGEETEQLAQDGVEMTMVFGVMIGAFKELSERLKIIEQKIGV